MSKMTEELKTWIPSFETGRTWYNKLLSDVTKRIYLLDFRKYCDAVGRTPDELIGLKINGLRSINTSKEFQAENLLSNWQ